MKDVNPDHLVHAAALFPDAIAHPETFPLIRRIEDVRAHVDPERGIHLFEQGDFIVCRYTSSLPETFRSAIDLEFRCLIFDRATGALLSRTFHKFFNLGERETLADVDLSQGWLEMKLDGSMVGAFVHNNEVVFHTRGGVSDHALAARRFASPAHLELVHDAFSGGYTPIFEFTSPHNRVVIPYKQEDLTLLALRHRETGVYDPDLASRLSIRHGVPLAQTIEVPDGGITRALPSLMTRDDVEGAVLVFPDGHRLKIKTHDYLRRHKILANISKEKYVYLCFLEDILDDTAAALGGERGRTLVNFIEQIDRRVSDVCRTAREEAQRMEHLSAAERAHEIKSRHHGVQQALVFAASKGCDPRDRLLDIMSRRVHTPEKRDSLKSELDLPNWDIDIHSLR